MASTFSAVLPPPLYSSAQLQSVLPPAPRVPSSASTLTCLDPTAWLEPLPLQQPVASTNDIPVLHEEPSWRSSSCHGQEDSPTLPTPRSEHSSASSTSRPTSVEPSAVRIQEEVPTPHWELPCGGSGTIDPLTGLYGGLSRRHHDVEARKAEKSREAVPSWPQRGRLTQGDRRELEQLLGRMVQYTALQCAVDQNPGLLEALEEHSASTCQREAEATRQKPKQRIEKDNMAANTAQRQTNCLRHPLPPSPPAAVKSPTPGTGETALPSRGIMYRRQHAPSPRQTRAQVLQMRWKGISAHAKKLREKAQEEERMRQKRNDAAADDAAERLAEMIFGEGPPSSSGVGKNNEGSKHSHSPSRNRHCPSEDCQYLQGVAEDVQPTNDSSTHDVSSCSPHAEEGAMSERDSRCRDSTDAALRPTASFGAGSSASSPRRQRNARSRRSLDERTHLPTVTSGKIPFLPSAVGSQSMSRAMESGAGHSSIWATEPDEGGQEQQQSCRSTARQRNNGGLLHRRTSEPGRACASANADVISGRLSTTSCSTWSEIAELLHRRMRAAEDDQLEQSSKRQLRRTTNAKNGSPPVSVSVEGPFFPRPSSFSAAQPSSAVESGIYRSRRLQSSPVVSEDGTVSSSSSAQEPTPPTRAESRQSQEQRAWNDAVLYVVGDKPQVLQAGSGGGGNALVPTLNHHSDYKRSRGHQRPKAVSSHYPYHGGSDESRQNMLMGGREELAHYGRKAPLPVRNTDNVGSGVPLNNKEQRGSGRQVGRRYLRSHEPVWTSVRASVPELGVQGQVDKESLRKVLPRTVSQSAAALPLRVSARNAKPGRNSSLSSVDGRAARKASKSSSNTGARRGSAVVSVERPNFGFGSSSVKPTAVPFERSNSSLLTSAAASRASGLLTAGQSYPYPQPDVYTLIGSRGSDANRGIQKKIIELLKLQAETVKEEREKAK